VKLVWVRDTVARRVLVTKLPNKKHAAIVRTTDGWIGMVDAFGGWEARQGCWATRKEAMAAIEATIRKRI